MRVDLPFETASPYDRCFDLLSKCMLKELLVLCGVAERVPADALGSLLCLMHPPVRACFLDMGWKEGVREKDWRSRKHGTQAM